MIRQFDLKLAQSVLIQLWDFFSLARQCECIYFQGVIFSILHFLDVVIVVCTISRKPTTTRWRRRAHDQQRVLCVETVLSICQHQFDDLAWPFLSLTHSLAHSAAAGRHCSGQNARATTPLAHANSYKIKHFKRVILFIIITLNGWLSLKMDFVSDWCKKKTA